MKLFDIDWQDFFLRLPVWQRLSPPARLAFAKMQPSQLQPLAKFNGEHYLLAESGFMTLERGSKKLRVNKDCWPFAATIRLMVNDDLLGNPGHDFPGQNEISLVAGFAMPQDGGAGSGFHNV